MQSFSAHCDELTHTLLLGSMPGVASLEAVQYYAHKRNAFWPIMLTIVSTLENPEPATNAQPDYAQSHNINYAERLSTLTANGFGLWDVLAECERKGSLDSAIISDSIVVNDFVGLLAQFPQIKKIAFNGKAAQRLFERHAVPLLDEHNINTDGIQWISLPSSSPAMASLSLKQKYQQWRAQLLD